MEAKDRIEQSLVEALRAAEHSDCPPQFRAALNYAVFPGGARIRPRLTLAVAAACGEDAPAVTDLAAASIELLHCASLVHDDLPCFDDAPMRRGKPSVHSHYGERLAVLVGDALIVQAYEVLSRVPSANIDRLAPLLSITTAAAALPVGMAAGQAWECESEVCVEAYHQAKTGSLFSAATMAGAAAVGVSAEPWRELGQCIGDAYQVADDLRDVLGDEQELGKPTGRDAALGRPSVVESSGVAGAGARLAELIGQAMAAIPACPGADQLRELIKTEATHFMPNPADQRAA